MPVPHPDAQRNEQPLDQFEGTVAAWDYNDRGHLHGFILDNATVVRVPPHLSDKLVLVPQTGDRILVRGRLHRTVGSDVHFDGAVIETAARYARAACRPCVICANNTCRRRHLPKWLVPLVIRRVQRLAACTALLVASARAD